MKRILAACLGGCLLCATTAHAGETAFAVRTTELKAQPYSDAATLQTLAANGKVEVVARRGGWTQVKTDKATGWVKMLSLRMSSAEGPRKTGDGGLGMLFNVVATGNSGSTVTTGVRGLSEENLKNPHPNPQALETLRGYAVSRADAARFAAAGHLKSRQMDYLPAPTQGEN